MKPLGPGWIDSTRINAEFESRAALGELAGQHPQLVAGIAQRFLDRRRKQQLDREADRVTRERRHQQIGAGERDGLGVLEVELMHGRRAA